MKIYACSSVMWMFIALSFSRLFLFFWRVRIWWEAKIASWPPSYKVIFPITIIRSFRNLFKSNSKQKKRIKMFWFPLADTSGTDSHLVAILVSVFVLRRLFATVSDTTATAVRSSCQFRRRRLTCIHVYIRSTMWKLPLIHCLSHCRWRPQLYLPYLNFVKIFSWTLMYIYYHLGTAIWILVFSTVKRSLYRRSF